MMGFSKYFSFFIVSLALLLTLAGCDSSNPAVYQPGPTATSTPIPPFVRTTAVTINGASKTILTDTNGFTLYYFTSDTATASACSGQCLSTWPLLLFNGSGIPTASTPLPGRLSLVPYEDAEQVAYNDHLLYRYSKDTSPGQTNGEGIAGKWFVATSDLAPVS
jgi:predicted lipoprotein with Yx(FWY)xxD motif